MKRHPKEILSPETTALIRKYAFAAEQKRALTDEVLNWIRHQEALRIMIPEDCGGAEWSLPRVVAYFEALAWADGNVGWLVNLGAGANMFAGYFDPQTAGRLFEAKDIWCAGSGATSGRAIRVEGGYRVTGRWKYASGSAHATHFTANAILEGTEQGTSAGSDVPDFRSFIFKRTDVQVLDTWQVTGLRATSSNDFAVTDVFVPDAHVFSLVKPSAFARGPLYRFPFEVLAVVNMACMPMGMALHFVDLFRQLMAEKTPLHRAILLKDHPQVKRRSATAIDSFLGARRQMYTLLDQAWTLYEKEQPADLPLLDALTAAARRAAEAARGLVFQLYPLCGMNMVFAGSSLNKVWRDLSVAGQHYLLSPLSE